MGELIQAKAPKLSDKERQKLENECRNLSREVFLAILKIPDDAKKLGIKNVELLNPKDTLAKIDAVDPSQGTQKYGPLFAKLKKIQETLTANIKESERGSYIGTIIFDTKKDEQVLLDTWGDVFKGESGKRDDEKHYKSWNIQTSMNKLYELKKLQPELAANTPSDENDAQIVQNAIDTAELDQLENFGFEANKDLNDFMRKAGMDPRITVYRNVKSHLYVAAMQTKVGYSFQILDGLTHNDWLESARSEKDVVAQTLTWLTPDALKGNVKSAQELNNLLDNTQAGENLFFMSQSDAENRTPLDKNLITKVGAPEYTLPISE